MGIIDILILGIQVWDLWSYFYYVYAKSTGILQDVCLYYTSITISKDMITLYPPSKKTAHVEPIKHSFVLLMSTDKVTIDFSLYLIDWLTFHYRS